MTTLNPTNPDARAASDMNRIAAMLPVWRTASPSVCVLIASRPVCQARAKSRGFRLSHPADQFRPQSADGHGCQRGEKRRLGRHQVGAPVSASST